MVMNVQPIASVSERINEIRGLTATIVDQEILTVENMLWATCIAAISMTTTSWRRNRFAKMCVRKFDRPDCGRPIYQKSMAEQDSIFSNWPI